MFKSAARSGTSGLLAVHRRAAAKARLEGAAIGITVPDLGDFACKSEGVAEIEREVGG